MRTVIKNRLYDTSTAKAIGHYIPPEGAASETMFRKKNGEYFLHRVFSDKPEMIVPLDYKDASTWGKMSLCDLDYNKAFLGSVQSSVVKVTLTREARGLLESEQSRTGKTYNEILSSLVVEHL